MTAASYVPNASWPIVPCDHGWEYETSEVKSSIVIDVRLHFILFFDQDDHFIFSLIPVETFQFDLVCDHAIYPTIGLVALNTGGPIGVYLFGTLNDR